MTKVLVLGLGGAGCALAHRFLEMRVEVTTINTDRSAFPGGSVPNSLLLGPRTCLGLPAISPARGRRVAEESIPQLLSLMAGYDAFILLAGLGGCTGTGAVPVIARLALDSGREIWAGLTLPFAIEQSRLLIASSAHASINMLVDCHVHDLARAAAAALDYSVQASSATPEDTLPFGPPGPRAANLRVLRRGQEGIRQAAACGHGGLSASVIANSRFTLTAPLRVTNTSSPNWRSCCTEL